FGTKPTAREFSLILTEDLAMSMKQQSSPLEEIDLSLNLSPTVTVNLKVTQRISRKSRSKCYVITFACSSTPEQPCSIQLAALGHHCVQLNILEPLLQESRSKIGRASCRERV